MEYLTKNDRQSQVFSISSSLRSTDLDNIIDFSILEFFIY